MRRRSAGEPFGGDDAGSAAGRNNDFYKICLSGSNDELQFSGGELKAYQTSRRQLGGHPGIPRIIDNLNARRGASRRSLTRYSKGYDAQRTTDSQDGVNLFYVQ